MEELPSMMPSTGEILVMALSAVVYLAVFVASFRRNRLLFGRSIVVSLLIGLVSASFAAFWVIASVINRADTAQRWRHYRAAHHSGLVPDLLVSGR